MQNCNLPGLVYERDKSTKTEGVDEPERPVADEKDSLRGRSPKGLGNSEKSKKKSILVALGLEVLRKNATFVFRGFTLCSFTKHV